MSDWGNSKAVAAFERDIPDAAEQETVLEIVSLAILGYDDDPRIHVMDVYKSDVINASGTLILTWKDVEYFVHIESGNNRGTYLHEWEGEGVAFEQPEPYVLALQPIPRLVSDAIMNGRGHFLVAKWDIFIDRPEIAKIVPNYQYDSFFQPGGKIANHYRELAASHLFEIVTQDVADETRKRLMEATEKVDVPAF